MLTLQRCWVWEVTVWFTGGNHAADAAERGPVGREGWSEAFSPDRKPCNSGKWLLCWSQSDRKPTGQSAPDENITISIMSLCECMAPNSACGKHSSLRYVCCVDYSLYFINVSYLMLLSTYCHTSYFLSEISLFRSAAAIKWIDPLTLVELKKRSKALP